MRNCDSELALSIKEFYFKELQLILSTHVVMSEKYKISIRRVSTSGTIFRYITPHILNIFDGTQVNGIDGMVTLDPADTRPSTPGNDSQPNNMDKSDKKVQVHAFGTPENINSLTTERSTRAFKSKNSFINRNIVLQNV